MESDVGRVDGQLQVPKYERKNETSNKNMEHEIDPG